VLNGWLVQEKKKFTSSWIVLADALPSAPFITYFNPRFVVGIHCMANFDGTVEPEGNFKDLGFSTSVPLSLSQPAHRNTD
jgi:hypothetical protein